MKKVDAIIREEKLPVVLAALEELGYGGITISPVKGHGRQKGIRQVYRGREFTVDFLPKIKVEIVVSDGAAPRVVAAIAEHARTGAIGDGKIWVTAVESLMRVRTGETGELAL